MRQAGVIAAAGLVALRISPSRLISTTTMQRFSPKGLAEIPQLSIDPPEVRTNIVICDCAKTGKTAVEFCEELYTQGIWAQDTALHSVRFVTHCDVDRTEIERALRSFARLLPIQKRLKHENYCNRCAVTAGMSCRRAVHLADWRRAGTRGGDGGRKLPPSRTRRHSWTMQRRACSTWVTKHNGPMGSRQFHHRRYRSDRCRRRRRAEHTYSATGYPGASLRRLTLPPELARKMLLVKLSIGFPRLQRRGSERAGNIVLHWREITAREMVSRS